MMKKLIIFTALVSLASFSKAQNYEDIVRFSRLTNFGTARSAAMGGAFGALGGDLSSMTYNPGGTGVFRKSEVGITGLINFATTKASGITSNKNSVQMGDIGFVASFYSPHFAWRGVNFGVNYTNLNNFNRKIERFIQDSPNSMTDYWAAETNSYGLNGTTDLALKTNLIYQDKDEIYKSVLSTSPNPLNELVNQSQILKEDGYQGEYAFSVGTNYMDQLYLGATIGVQSLWYKQTVLYQEVAPLESPTGLNYYNYGEELKINGVGVNFKVGAIYRPIPELRLGVALHTPTWYNISQDYSNYIDAIYLPPNDHTTGRVGYDKSATSQLYSLDYNMKTPWRAIFSIASVLGQRAILSFDYEYTDYTNGNFSDASDNLSMAENNDYVKSTLRATHNFRAGGELRVNSNFSLRAGYSFFASPYDYNVRKSNDRVENWSGGIGVNFGSFYCDAAYVYKISRNYTMFYSYIDPYDPSYDFSSEWVKNKYVTNEARLTVGFKF